MKNYNYFSLLLVFFILVGCESNTYREIVAKTEVPTYTKDIKAIIDNNCISCHYVNSDLAPFSLTDYISVKNTTELGDLIYRIETATGLQSMPLGDPKLNTSQIELIKLWAAQGYKN